MLKQIGADIVYQAHVDAANPDLKPEILRMQAAGAEAIMPWSVNAGFLSRIINTRGQLDWDVPICRPDHARLGPDQGAAREARILGQGLSEQLPPGLLRPRRQAPRAHRRFRREDPRREDRHERHAAVVDRGRLRHAVPDRRRDQERTAPSRRRSSRYWNQLKDYPGVYGDYQLHAGRAQRLSGPAGRHGRSQLAQGRRVQSRSGLRRRLSRWSNRLFCRAWRSAASTH